MYKIDNKKRYNVNIVNEKGTIYKIENVQLKVAERNFIVVMDKDNKEHILTGGLELYLTEI